MSQQVRESAHALLDSGGNKSDEDKEAIAANTPIVIVHQDSISPDEGIVLGPFCTKSQCGKNHSQIVSFCNLRRELRLFSKERSMNFHAKSQHFDHFFFFISNI